MDDMEARLSRLESDVEYIKRDVADVKADVRQIRQDLNEQNVTLARVEERMTHLPSTDYMLKAFLLFLTIIGALITLAPKIQHFFKID
ncbi:MAG: hypothetical protein ACR65U_02105 [Methylocystis sp.]